LLPAVTTTARPCRPGFRKSAVARFTARPGDAATFAIQRATAIETVRSTAFLGDGPRAEPTAIPVLVSGRIGRGPILASPSGKVEAEIPVETAVPFWVVAWLGAPGEEIGPFWNPANDAVVDVVFLVDGVTGDCCWLNLFSPSR
jgi:hypothetical protein